MRCYRCGNELGSGHYCLHCGAEVTEYRRIIRLSGTYYNAGLEKARLRDISGAIAMLTRSLELWKKNTDARNLLGLCYYEIGEVVEALCQWVVSKNLQTENNRADYYLNTIQHDRNTLDTMNQAIRKYNQALRAAKGGRKDVAAVQLKRVIRQHPHFIKAYELLALIRIDDEQYAKAQKLIRQALKIDKGNTLCQRYLKRVQGRLNRSPRQEMPVHRRPEEAVLETSPTSADVIVPDYTEPPKRRYTVRAAVIGLCAGLALYQFVIARTVSHNSNVAENQAIASYDSKLSDKELEVSGLQDQVTQMSAENESLQNEISDLTGDSGISAQYDALLNVYEMYVNKQESTADTDIFTEFEKIDASQVSSDKFQEVYSQLKQYVTVDCLKDLFDSGVALYNDSYYKKAIPVFEQCLEINADYADAMYYLGLCYERRSDSTNALKYYKMIIDGNYTDSEYYDLAQQRMEALNESTAEESTVSADSGNGADTGN